MDPLVEELIELLDREAELWDSLKGSLLGKKRAVIEARIEPLHQICRDIEAIQERIRQMEIHRRRLMSLIAPLVNSRSADLTLQRLSEHVPEPHRSRLQMCRSKLMLLITDTRKINEGVRAVLVHARELVDMSFNALSAMVHPHAVYGQSGTAERRHQIGRILSHHV